MRLVFLLLLSLQLFCVSGNTDIEFGGFIPDTVYTYYTNGFNTYTQLTCNATSNTYTIINTTWIIVTANTDTDSSVLRFEDIAKEVTWGDQRDYLCRAFYLTDTVMYQDSYSITVVIKYNTTITVSYGDIIYIRDTTSNVYIPVMTENIIISCDADMAKWIYRPTGLTEQTDVPNPVLIDLFTIQYATGYSCTNMDINNKRVIVNTVTLKAYGSGIYKQQQDSYTQLTVGETVLITEDTTLVCVSSIAGNSAWYYRDISTGVYERVTDDTDVIDYKGFLTLSLQTTSRAGYYICQTLEVTDDTYTTGIIVHSIIVSVPIVTATATPIPTGPVVTTPITTPATTTITTTTTTTVSIELSYTPDYDNLFVGFDDVTLTCVVITDSVQMLNVTLIDVSTEHILQSQFGNYATVLMYHNLELQTGTMSYRCRVVTERGVVKQDTVTVRIQDIYTQGVINLHTETETGGVRLSWDTTHPLLANESFLLSVYDVSTGVREVITSQRLEYSLTHLSHSHTYSIRVQVVNRLNNTHNYTQISYTYTEITTSTQIYIVVYSVAGLLLFIVLLAVVLAIVVCSVILVRNVLKSKKTNKYKYTKSLEETTPSANTSSDKKEYISLSYVHTVTRLPQTHGYEPMTSVYSPQREYVPLEVTTPPNYCEIPESHFESENDSRQYENLSSIISS